MRVRREARGDERARPPGRARRTSASSSRLRASSPAADGERNGRVEDVLPGEAAVARAARALARRTTSEGLPRIWPFLGPAFIAAVAYIDPGNFATNIAGGAKFGYLLLWVVLGANLIAMVVQTQSAKLGIATGKNLAEACRDTFSRRTSIGLWIQAEIVAAACDVAEVVGAALGLNLLFGIPLFPAGLLAGAGAFAILGLQQKGFRRLEAGIVGMVGVVVLAFAFEIFNSNPDGGEVAQAPLHAGLRGHREHPARHGHHRRDRDAARDLPALGADPAADRGPKRPREARRSCASSASTS